MKSYPIWNEYLCTQSQRMTQKLAWSERRQVKYIVGAKKTESDGGREKERRTFSSSPHFSSSSLLHAAPYYLEA